MARLPSAVPLPPGYSSSTGRRERGPDARSSARCLLALGLAVLLMYFVLVVQFGSFLDPFAIMLSLPLSLIGVMLALLVTGTTLNIMSMIGVILLMGIVAKNAILLDRLREVVRGGGHVATRGASSRPAASRLRPILMTTFALIAGMMPVAIGAGEGARLPRAARPRGHRRRHHLDAC